MLGFNYKPPQSYGAQHYTKIVSPWSEESIGDSLRAWAIGAAGSDFAWNPGWVSGVPFSVTEPGLTLRSMWQRCGTGVGNNIDMGVTDLAGVVLASTGSVPRVNITQVNGNMLAPFPIPVGDYYMVLTGDSTSFMGGSVAVSPAMTELLGLVTAGGGFPLAGKTLSFIPSAWAFVPYMGLNYRSVLP